MHSGRKGTLGEATVSTGNHVLSPDQPGIGRNAQGDEFRMLDEVRRMGDHTWDEDLAVRQLDVFPHLPLMLMARIGSFHTVGVSTYPQHDVHNVLQRYIGNMVPMRAPPAQMIPDAVRRTARQG